MVTNSNVIKLWKQRDTLASNYIYATVTDKMREYLINCDTSAAMWSRLSTRFTLRSIANKGQLWSQFYEYKFNQSQDMLANITSVESLVRQLKDLEETITEVQTTNKIVSILPSQFQHFRIVWDTYKESEQTMELLTLRLLAEERRVEATKRETQETSSSKPAEAFIATHQNRRWNQPNHRGGNHNSNNRGRNQAQQSNWRKRPNVYCDFHNSSTHSSEECRNRPGNKKQKTDHHAKISILESEEQKVDHSFHVTEDFMKSTETTDDWYADSGATRHMSCNQKLFSSLQSEEGNQQLDCKRNWGKTSLRQRSWRCVLQDTHW